MRPTPGGDSNRSCGKAGSRTGCGVPQAGDMRADSVLLGEQCTFTAGAGRGGERACGREPGCRGFLVGRSRETPAARSVALHMGLCAEHWLCAFWASGEAAPNEQRDQRDIPAPGLTSSRRCAPGVWAGGKPLPGCPGASPGQAVRVRPHPPPVTEESRQVEPTEARRPPKMGHDAESAPGGPQLPAGPLAALLPLETLPCPSGRALTTRWAIMKPPRSSSTPKTPPKFPSAPGQPRHCACGARLPQDALGRLRWSERARLWENRLRGPPSRPQRGAAFEPQLREEQRGPGSAPLCSPWWKGCRRRERC